MKERDPLISFLLCAVGNFHSLLPMLCAKCKVRPPFVVSMFNVRARRSGTFRKKKKNKTPARTSCTTILLILAAKVGGQRLHCRCCRLLLTVAGDNISASFRILRERRRSFIGMFLPSNRIFLSAKYLKPCRQLPRAILSIFQARSCHKTLREQEFSCRFHRHQPRRPGSDARSQATSALGSVAGSSGRLQQSILSISRPTTRRLKRRRTHFLS